MKKHNSLIDKNLSKTVMKALRLGWLVGRWLVCKSVDLLDIINRYRGATPILFSAIFL